MNETFLFVTITTFWLWFAISLGIISGLLARISDLEER